MTDSRKEWDLEVAAAAIRPYHGWDWVIRSYDSLGRFCLETTHRGNHSRDMELDAIKRCGRTARVWKVKPDGSLA